MGNALPWNYKSIARSLIDDNEKKRRIRFQEARARSADISEKLRDEILALGFFQLRDALQNDQYNARTVLTAYTYKALQVQDEINCLAEFLIEAFEKADAIDAKFSGKSDKPPLYGLPFSVKENFFIKDYDCCVGLAKFLNDPKKHDCTFIALLNELGAVPFVMTNVPQALLSFVCSNSVYGTTGNPKDNTKIPGGSSGGEAALLAARGSSFGTGSDLAGSLRIPASMCGVVALKPTEARISIRHCVGGIPGKGRMALGIGFFTHTVDEHIFLLEQILTDNFFHKTAPKSVPLPIRKGLIDETANKKSLRIGYFVDDGFLKPTPGCERVVNETVKKLEELGHELVRFDIPRPYEAAQYCFRSIMTDGGTYLAKLYSRDIVDQYLTSFVTLINLPLFVRYLGSFIIGSFSPQAKVLARAYVKSIEELRVNQEQVDNYTEEIFDLMNEQKLDAIVCPSFTIPAVPHKYPSLLGACGFATALWNMVDFPAGTVPVDTWTDEDDAHLQDERVWPVGNNFILKMMREAATKSKGLPLCVQVVAKPYQEEVCLGVMKIVEDAWRKSK